ncbi:MAG: hypothetical protein KDD06_19695 [Phaeodactylibacter sp.]|nr:hypothetical protein [Phaeodactylibacter sp.]MCB9264756.1 hypothetical protein [Lewinellaceae bacterium]MCB9287747.1 hypothetical protein [Lewinellaceae bacterium]
MKNFHLLLSLVFCLSLPLFSGAQQLTPQAVGLLPSNYTVFGISAPSEDVAWAIAFDSNVPSPVPLGHQLIVLKTIDGGENWEAMEVEEAAGYISFDIQAFDENTAFFTGQTFGNSNPYGVFKTVDGGQTWEWKPAGVAGGVWLRFFDETHGLCINRQYMRRTLNGGDTWGVINGIPSFNNNEYTLLYSGTNSCTTVKDTVYFGTSNGNIYKSTDRGENWVKIPTGLTNSETINSVAFSDGYHGLGTSNAKFVRTDNGGEGWETFFAPIGYRFTNIAHVPGTESSFVATSALGSGGLAYTEDFGDNWTIVADLRLTAIDFASPYTAWIGAPARSNADDPPIIKWEADFFVVDVQEVQPPEGLEVFPNPAADYLAVKVPEEYQAGLQGFTLYSSTGQKVRSWDYDGSRQLNISLHNIPPGAYSLQPAGEKPARPLPVVIQR